MSCGLNEDDLVALEGAGRLASSGGRKPCSGNGCSPDGGCDDSSTCKTDKAQDRRTGTWAAQSSANRTTACMKCKATRAVVLVRQREPLCQACLEAGISGKVRALKTHKLLLPHDNVAVAFSGGFSSQALLCNVLPMRKDASTPRKERGKIEFDLTVIHVNEATAYGMSAEAAEAHAAAVHEAARRCGATEPAAQVVVVSLSDVFLDPGPAPGGRRGQSPPPPQQQQPPPPQELPPSASAGPHAHHDGCGPEGTARAVADAGAPLDGASAKAGHGGGDNDGGGSGDEGAAARAERERRLQALLQAVPDPTGREDLLRYLRGRVLAATAARLGATKVLQGECATALAARVVAETSKGRGYALPGDIQLVDARGVTAGGPAVLYAMREVSIKEAVYFCRLRGLMPAPLPYFNAKARRSINELAVAFVDSLQANLPSTIFTVLRTAAALKPFPFNSPDALTPISPSPAPAPVPAQVRHAADAAAPAVGTAGEGSLPGTAPGAAAPPPPAAAGDASAVAPSTQGCSAAQLTHQRAAAAAVAGCRMAGGLACCALCRAPLMRREQEAIAAAVAARDASRAAQLGRRTRAEAGPATAAGGGSQGTPAADDAVEESDDEDGDGDENDLAAPFCTSCRSQVLFSPGHPDVVTTNATGGVGSPGTSRSLLATLGLGSSALPLLPAALRAWR